MSDEISGIPPAPPLGNIPAPPPLPKLDSSDVKLLSKGKIPNDLNPKEKQSVIKYLKNYEDYLKSKDDTIAKHGEKIAEYKGKFIESMDKISDELEEELKIVVATAVSTNFTYKGMKLGTKLKAVLPENFEKTVNDINRDMKDIVINCKSKVKDIVETEIQGVKDMMIRRLANGAKGKSSNANKTRGLGISDSNQLKDLLAGLKKTGKKLN